MDSYGEDGNFKEKAAEIERFDHILPRILALEPEVLIITGDHSTPSLLKGHSWHPVPVPSVLLMSLEDSAILFQRGSTRGELGIFPTVNLMPLALANALRLKNSVHNVITHFRLLHGTSHNFTAKILFFDLESISYAISSPSSKIFITLYH